MGGVHVLADHKTDLQGLRDLHNRRIRGDMGVPGFGRQRLATDFDGSIPSVNGSVATTGNYTDVLRNGAGNHLAGLLAATSPTATPSPANAVLLVQDAFLAVGAGRALRLYATAGSNYGSLVSDANGLLTVSGSGSGSGKLSVSALITPTIGPSSTQQHTLPAVTSDTIALLAAAQTFTNKTLTSPTINGGALSGTFSGTPTFSGAVTMSSTLSVNGEASAKIVETAKCSGALTLTGSLQDITGCSVTLTPGEWVVTGVFDFNVIGTDTGFQMQGALVTSGGTASVTTSANARLQVPTATHIATVSQTWRVSVTATTTAKLQALKTGGTGTSAAGIQSTITAAFVGKP